MGDAAQPLLGCERLLGSGTAPRAVAATTAIGVSHAVPQEIHQFGAQFNVYFAARNRQGTLCVGVAVARNISGPYIDIGHPLVANQTDGAIDPTVQHDDRHAPYLIYKIDGNARGAPTPILAAPLRADGLAVTGSPQELISNTEPWEGALVEAPWIVRRGNEYFLFYSGNGYTSPDYAVGVARAPRLLGPYRKANGPVVLHRSQQPGVSWRHTTRPRAAVTH